MPNEPIPDTSRSRFPGKRLPWPASRLIFAAAFAAAVVSAGVTALVVNISEHKVEAKNPFFRVVEITDDTDDPAAWGKNFPQQYDGYKRTVDMVRTHFGGSEAVPHTPSQADPRSVVAQSKIEQDPRLKVLWSGYAFAVDFREDRGHAYMLDDQTFTGRQQAAKQPGTCINCHASTYVAMKRLGGGDLLKGFDLLNAKPYAEARNEVVHPVSCIDCHDPKTMQLRVTRPAFMEGIRKIGRAHV
jgi:nitrite reductase (cytochrome c-552)